MKKKAKGENGYSSEISNPIVASEQQTSKQVNKNANE